VVFLMARDQNIPAVKELRDNLAGDGLIEAVETYEFALRADFKARVLHRERAIIVALRRRRAGEEPPDDDAHEVADEEIEVFDFEAAEAELAEPTTERDPEPVAVGSERGSDHTAPP
jgi:hypothetical protein